MGLTLRVTINYPEDEKEYEATPESEECSTPGEAIDAIVAREKNATSFVFVISRKS